MYTYDVGMSKNGQRVYANIIHSSAGRYFSRQPYLVRLVRDMLALADLSKPVLSLSYDMGRVIGNTNIVATEAKDSIYYASPPKQANFLRFVKNRSMESSSQLTIVLKRDADTNYEIVDVWIGPLYPPFPDAANATSESKQYWQGHALTAGSEPINLQSLTTVCPY